MRNIIVLFLLAICTSATAQSFDSCTYYRKQRDSINHKLYMSRQQVNAVKFYMAITAPSKNVKINKQHKANRQFFYGWITQRAMVPFPSLDTTKPKPTN